MKNAIEESKRRLGKFRVVNVTPTKEQGDRALDQALEETFPASDSVAIAISDIVRVKSAS